MPADRVQISPDKVHAVAAEFRTTATNTQEMGRKLQTLMQGMQPEWQGMTSRKFYEEFAQWMTAMNQFVERLNGISTELDTIANDFQTLDETLLR